MRKQKRWFRVGEGMLANVLAVRKQNQDRLTTVKQKGDWKAAWDWIFPLVQHHLICLYHVSHFADICFAAVKINKDISCGSWVSAQGSPFPYLLGFTRMHFHIQRSNAFVREMYFIWQWQLIQGTSSEHWWTPEGSCWSRLPHAIVFSLGASKPFSITFVIINEFCFVPLTSILWGGGKGYCQTIKVGPKLCLRLMVGIMALNLTCRWMYH